MTRRGQHAVVLGASMAGLLTARVLTEFYDHVSLIERDELDDSAAPRRGVPQSRQPHLLLARCGLILEELFPGITADLVAGGAHEWRDGDLSRFHAHFGGHLLARDGRIPDPGSVVNYFASRAFLESHVRRRVLALPTLTLMDRHDIDSLVCRGCAVTGVRVTSRADRATRDIDADLVVDATGRGSRTPAFLEQMGYPRPREDHLAVNVCYVSMPVRIPDGALHEYLIVDLFKPGKPRGFAMLRCENDTWIAAIGTLGKDVEAPASAAELMAFAEPLMPPHVFAAIKAGEPLDDVALHRFPANRWRRYDRMVRFPAHLLVTGDAVCSFNPIYGQGMTVAAVEVMTLRGCLRRSGTDLPRRFHRAAAKTVAVAWRTAVGSDLSLPEVEGPRTLSARLSNGYVDRVLRAAETDPWVAQQFFQVTGMLSPPAVLFRPAMLRRLAGAATRRPDTVRPVDVGATA
ncbi:FAD-dependent oxidoreductase [Mycolicibacterium chubuense]|nr:2-polyprenyl-6-methoxyphenol hydroxylase-like oxidoreductase [Mycolicibacterium chubuense]